MSVALPDEYKLAIDRQEQESTRYWSRSNMMLLVQGVLITFYAGIYKYSGTMALFLSIEGLFLSMTWMAILSQGKRYVRRWDKVISHIETNVSAIKYPLCKLYGQYRSAESRKFWPPFGWSTTTFMEIAVGSTIVFWIVLLSMSSARLYHSDLGDFDAGARSDTFITIGSGQAAAPPALGGSNETRNGNAGRRAPTP